MRPARIILTLVIVAGVLGPAGSVEAKIQFGMYTGTGAPVTISTAFTADMVWVFGLSTTGRQWETKSPAHSCGFAEGGNTCASGALVSAWGVSSITLTSTFSSGGQTYQWVAFASEDLAIAYNTYAGNDASNRTITVGSGWQPDWVFLYGGNTGLLITQSMAIGVSGVAGSMSLANGGNLRGNDCQTTNIDPTQNYLKWAATGFTVCAPAMNANGASYYWIALKANNSKGTYKGTITGNALDNQAWPLASAIPLMAMCATTGPDGGSSLPPYWRTDNLAANTAKPWANTDTGSTTVLKAFDGAGLTLGASDNCNRNGTPIDALVLRQDLGGASCHSAPVDVTLCRFRLRR